MEIDKELIKRIKGLQLKDIPEVQPGILVPLPNRQKNIDYVIRVVTQEFTSLCPLSLQQPDYATITIEYIPKDKIVELKSLKLYFVSYRNTQVFHEDVPATILKDLVALLSPQKMTVIGQFTIRGGLKTTVEAKYESNSSKKS